MFLAKEYINQEFFEIILGKTNVGKEHFFHFENGQLFEYPYLAIRTWADAFVKQRHRFMVVLFSNCLNFS